MNDEQNNETNSLSPTTNAGAKAVTTAGTTTNVVSIGKKRRSSRRTRTAPYPAKEKEAIMAMVGLHNGSIDDLLKENPQLQPMRRSLYYWKEKGIRPTRETSEYMAQRLDEIVLQCLDLLPEKLPEASVRDITGCMHISIDKARLLREQATTITANIDLRKEVAEVLGVTIEVLPE